MDRSDEDNCVRYSDLGWRALVRTNAEMVGWTLVILNSVGIMYIVAIIKPKHSDFTRRYTRGRRLLGPYLTDDIAPMIRGLPIESKNVQIMYIPGTCNS